jgi:hypothetical protein
LLPFSFTSSPQRSARERKLKEDGEYQIYDSGDYQSPNYRVDPTLGLHDPLYDREYEGDCRHIETDNSAGHNVEEYGDKRIDDSLGAPTDPVLGVDVAAVSAAARWAGTLALTNFLSFLNVETRSWRLKRKRRPMTRKGKNRGPGAPGRALARIWKV